MIMRAILASCLLLLPLHGQDPAEILRRSAELDAADSERLKNYTYVEITEARQHNGKKPDTVESTTSEVTILAGAPYRRLVAKDDKPLPQKDQRKQQEKMDREIAKRQRQSPSDKSKKEKQEAAERKFLSQLPEALILRLEGVEEVAGKPAWIISGEPRPGFRPKDSDVKILTKLRGKVWIDQAEYRWVKAEIELVDTVSMDLALLRLAPGTRLTFEQTRVNEEVWLPSHAHIQAAARLGYLFKASGDIDITYRDYRKFQTDSRIVAEEEKK